MTYIDFGKEPVEQGWQCPICKRVYAPDVPMCFYCGSDVKTTTKIEPDTVQYYFKKFEGSNSDTEVDNDSKINITNSKE